MMVPLKLSPERIDGFMYSVSFALCTGPIMVFLLFLAKFALKRPLHFRASKAALPALLSVTRKREREREQGKAVYSDWDGWGCVRMGSGGGGGEASMVQIPRPFIFLSSYVEFFSSC